MTSYHSRIFPQVPSLFKTLWTFFLELNMLRKVNHSLKVVTFNGIMVFTICYQLCRPQTFHCNIKAQLLTKFLFRFGSHQTNLNFRYRRFPSAHVFLLKSSCKFNKFKVESKSIRRLLRRNVLRGISICYMRPMMTKKKTKETSETSYWR